MSTHHPTTVAPCCASHHHSGTSADSASPLAAQSQPAASPASPICCAVGANQAVLVLVLANFQSCTEKNLVSAHGLALIVSSDFDALSCCQIHHRIWRCDGCDNFCTCRADYSRRSFHRFVTEQYDQLRLLPRRRYNLGSASGTQTWCAAISHHTPGEPPMACCLPGGQFGVSGNSSWGSLAVSKSCFSCASSTWSNWRATGAHSQVLAGRHRGLFSSILVSISLIIVV